MAIMVEHTRVREESIMSRKFIEVHTKTPRRIYDELYEEISDHWLEKARRLQTRRWRALKHELRGKRNGHHVGRAYST